MKNISVLKNAAVLNILEDIRAEITASLGAVVKEIILYGSYARNEQTEFSDIDIAVLIDGERGNINAIRDKLADIKVDLSLKYDVVISIIVKKYRQYVTRKEFVPFYAVIEREGISLHA
ncbi:MAG: nucleotidyltransferase domain-containing protein [Candidatus Aminicenantes bacterium]|nr:nucleotidyltransferase domain-containing protein [Candidatus Aminicenantes bacterium]